MDTTLSFAPKTVAAVPYVAEREPPRDNKVPVVKRLDGAATLPANKTFVAQVVSARLSGTAFPENPTEIAPAERTLRPYNTPMLPYENKAEEDVKETEIDADAVASSADDAQKTDDRELPDVAASAPSEVDEDAEPDQPALADTV